MLGRVLWAGFALFFLWLAVWGWYAWVGSVPKVSASVRYDETGYSGQIHLVQGEQAVLLHGGHLRRHDFNEGKELWSKTLIDEPRILRESKENYERMVAERQRIIRDGGEYGADIGTLEELVESNKRQAGELLRLHARGEAVWASSPGKLTRYDWKSGQLVKEIDIAEADPQFVANGDDLLVRLSQHSVLHLNLLTGDSRTEKADIPEPAEVIKASPVKTPSVNVARTAAATNSPVAPRSGGRTLTPIGRMVAPALTAASNNQHRLGTELRSSTPATLATPASSGFAAAIPTAPAALRPGEFQLIVSRHGSFQIAAKELGNRTINGENVNAHLATVRRVGAGAAATWSEEVPGLPELHSLPTLTLLIARQSVVVLDKGLKKVWDKRIEGTVRPPSKERFIPETPPLGEGPCVERNGTLYVCDGAGVNAFDPTNGTLRWRTACLDPSSVVFDDKGDLYVNIVVSGSDKAYAGVQKIEAATGKALWKAEREGSAAHASGKLLYTVDSYRGDADDSDGLPGMRTIFHVAAFLRIRRLDMETGKVKWGHVQERFPLDVRFEKNSFQLLFKKEVQLLKFVHF